MKFLSVIIYLFLSGQCVSAYVRHGDKSSEMKLMPFSAYANATLELFNRMETFGLIPGQSTFQFSQVFYE